MGILDDAIRQHLDLKRRQGAEADELQRLEDEAFGPPSRPGEPDFPQHEDPPVALEGESAPPAEHFVDEAELFVEAPAVPAVEELDRPAEAEPESTEHSVEPESAEHPVEPASLEQPIESLDTVEHDLEGAIGEPGESEPVEDAEVVEGELADDDNEDEDDVLEETPEFLRDQPEDDELWFEQGEPKDFDF